MNWKLKWFEGLGEAKEPEPDLTALDRDGLLAQLEQDRQQENTAGIAKVCYTLGTRYMEAGDAARAILYLCRCDALADTYPGVQDALGEETARDCAARLTQLGEAPVLTSEIIAQVAERAEVLNDLQVRQWGLMTMARLARVGRRLSVLQGCQALGRLGQTVKLLQRSFYAPLSQEEIGFLQETCSQLYHLVDSPLLLDPENRIPAPAGPLEAADLNGGMICTQLNLYLDNHLHVLGGQKLRAEPGLIPCALLSDYYLRVVNGPLERMAPIRAELRRIQDDQKFLRKNPSRDALEARVQGYLMMDILETP